MAVATVDEYMSSIPTELQEVATALKPVIDAGLPETQCQMWHGQPVWMVGKKPVAMLKAYPKYITFGLFKGTSVSDASGRLEAGSSTMSAVKLKSVNEIDQPLFADWLRQALSLELQ